MHFDLMLWLPVLSLFLGLLLHSLSADGGASILDHYGTSKRLPKLAVPALITLLGLGAGIVDTYLAGGGLQHAIVTALATTIAGLAGTAGGHSLSRVAGMVLVAFFALQMTACKEALHKAEVIIARDAECLVNSQNLPDEEALLRCGVEELQRDVGKKILHASRANSAKEAADAANRVRAIRCGGDAGVEGGK